MVHFIFLIKTSHFKESHKIGFTKLIFAKKPKTWIWIKENEGNDATLTAGPACQGRLPHGRGDSHQRFLRDDEVSGQTKGTNLTLRPLRTDWPLFPAAEPPEIACRRPWRLGEGARRYAIALRPVERDLGFPIAPELRRCFLGRRLGMKRRAMSWPRESPTPAETRRRCASCPAMVSAVERPPIR